MMLRVSVSHLLGPLVHSRPLRTVIKVEQYVLTATRLQRGDREGEREGERYCIGLWISERRQWDNMRFIWQNCFQSLRAKNSKACERKDEADERKRLKEGRRRRRRRGFKEEVKKKTNIEGRVRGRRREASVFIRWEERVSSEENTKQLKTN